MRTKYTAIAAATAFRVFDLVSLERRVMRELAVLASSHCDRSMRVVIEGSLIVVRGHAHDRT